MSEEALGQPGPGQETPGDAAGAGAPGESPPQPPPLRPTSDFMRRVEKESGVGIGACYGCKKCSNGCPMSFAMDLHPYQVVRLVQLGQSEELLNCRTIWICASCQTCLTRCPNQVDLPRLMDYLKQTLIEAGGASPEPNVLLFNQIFLKEIKARGRVFEGSLMARYQLMSEGVWGPSTMDNMRLGLTMLKKGRMKLIPSRIKDRRWLKGVFTQKPPGEKS